MKKTLALILALAMALSLCACGGKDTNKDAAAADAFDTYAAQYGKIDGLHRDITIASRMDIQKLDPTSGTGAPKDEFYWNIYECLFEFDEQQNLYPDLAKGYAPAEDGSYWDIFLFETIKDSEGNDITAEDVEASFAWLVDSGEALKYENVKSWEAVDPYTFRIYWNHEPASPDDYEFPLCRTYVFDSKYKGSDFATQPVGTGNYLVVDFVTGNHLTLWANPGYWADNTSEDLTGRMNLHDAHVQMITYEIITESATAEVALEEGRIDFCNYITQRASIDKFKEKYADQYVVDDSRIAGSYFFLEPNMDSSSLLGRDENLRLAIYYGLSSDTIATLMGSGYVPMKTLGHRGFSDFNPEWENEENYCSVYDPDLAKEYLAKSSYNNEDLAIVCKTSEIEKNAAQSILSQLTALGIKCHMNSIDNSIFTSETSDPANFDMILFEMGGPSLVSSMGLPLGQPNTNEDGTDGWSLNFIRDNELYDLLQVAKADSTHTDENVKAVIDYALGHSYIYPIAYSFTCYIYSNEITNLYTRETTVTPAACTYAGQTAEAEKGVMFVPDASAAGDFDPALAGEYFYAEAPKFGNKDNEFWLTLNDDGTYKLNNNNGAGEEVWTEGTWTVTGKDTVYLSASEVQGAMNRLLVDWVTDFEHPDPTFVLNTADGTMVPYVPADPASVAGSYTYSEKANFGSKDNDFTLTLNADGTYRLDCNNSVGENIWTEGTFEINPDSSVALSASPVSGDMDRLLNSGWADQDNPAPVFVLNAENGTMVPEGVEASVEEPAEEAPAASDEVPGIVTGLEGNGFERFTFWENNEMMGRSFTWYVMKSDGMTIVITPNEMLGTEDGLGVWHFTDVTEDKGILTLKGLEDGDKALPTMGDQWTDKDNFEQQWQIFGKGWIMPANMKDADAYKAAVNAGEIPAKAAEAPAEEAGESAGEEPFILTALADAGFERFDWLETSPVGEIPWHVLINHDNGEAIIVVENPHLGTADGLLVYHCTFTEEKGLVSCSEPEEPDSEMKRLGSMWNEDGTSQWQITGKGVITAIDAK